MKLGFVGGGTVGSALAKAFHEQTVLVYDLDKSRSNATFAQAMQCEIIFVCLPTPKLVNSLSCDTGILDKCLKRMQGSTKCIVLKSTVPVGYTKHATTRYELPNLLHSPEFLTARTAERDAANPIVNMVGEPDGPTGQLLCKLYEYTFPFARVLRFPSNVTELVKLAQNAFFATKVAFFNELSILCKSLQIPYEAVREGITADDRIPQLHTKVPGPDGKYGFGGECLTKDLASYIDHMATFGLGCQVAGGAYVRNVQDRGRR